MAEQRLNSLADRLERVASRLESCASKPAGASNTAVECEVFEAVEMFDSNVMEGKLKKYFELSNTIGGDVQKHAEKVKACYNSLRDVIVTASKHKNPKPNVIQEVLKPLSGAVSAVQEFTDKNRGSKLFNHLMTLKEGIGCVGWVSVAPKPVNYVKEMHDQALFYGNRVLKEYKGKDDKHVEWMRAFTGSIKELEGYVKEYHLVGLTWNPDGAVLTNAPNVSAPPPPGPPGGPPGGPPPPPPPAVLPPSDVPTSKPSGARPDATALFASINKGANITSGLKKVTNDMKTHKNPELRASSVVKAGEIQPKSGTSSTTKPAAVVKKPPVFGLQGQKFMVEYQEDKTLDIDIKQTRTAVIIYKCSKCTIRVSNKCNSIFIDSCKRVGLVFDGVVSSVEVINSQSIQVQSQGQCNTVSIDKTDGCQVYLSKECLDVEIITAKSSEMNISIPNESGEYDEFAVPEQFKTKWNGKRLVTECTDING